MRAGRLSRDRAVFEKPVRTPDGAGGFTVTWQEQFTVPAALRPERGRERLQADRIEASLVGVVTVRSDSLSRQVTEEWRVVIRGDVFDIRSIANPDRRNVGLEMMVERRGERVVATIFDDDDYAAWLMVA